MFQMKLTREEALSMAEAILNSNFNVYGIGHFDVSNEELATILILAFNYKNIEDREHMLYRYYCMLHNKVFVNDKIKVPRPINNM